ncbi:MAG: ADP-glyceromanno-heptose 6-epimerase [Siphonobacter sp.]
MIIVTGAAGFIGSNLIRRLNQDKFNFIIAVDDFSDPAKKKNLEGKTIQKYVDRDQFFDWLDQHYDEIEFLFHLGARTDESETNYDVFDHLNVQYSKQIWRKCVAYQIPLIYASSAATYGAGEHGFEDNEALIPELKPLNAFSESKNQFDIWAIEQEEKPFFWAGLKFFNVYGPNEYHKGHMASVILHAYLEIRERGTATLFRSNRPEIQDGEQMRDFVYVKDVIEVCIFLMYSRKHSGIYNVGTGKARSFRELVQNTFWSLHRETSILFSDMPACLQDHYQYFTEATLSKLRSIGYDKPFFSIEEGVADYVVNYLKTNQYH